MKNKIAALVFIYVMTVIAWFILGSTVYIRTFTADTKLKTAVANFGEQLKNNKVLKLLMKQQVLLASSHTINLRLDHRRKGLLWYPTYYVNFSGKYKVKNSTDKERTLNFKFPLPARETNYDNLRLIVDGKETEDIEIKNNTLNQAIELKRGQVKEVEVSYGSQGMDNWQYKFGKDVKQVKNFALTMVTDFKKIDFPENSISPKEKRETQNGWELKWRYKRLLSGAQIGMVMPKKLNPGPWVNKIIFFAPISLFFFFFLVFIFTTLRGIKIHPMNYFFVSAAFFSFHLLLAYLVDHIDINLAFFISSLVSIFLVISYMRLVVGAKFAFLEIGISQLVYLVLFSYTFFFEGYTGLTVTIMSIITLFIVMQFTGGVDWEKIFAASEQKTTKRKSK